MLGSHAGAQLQPVPEPIIDAIESIHLPSMPQVLLRFLRMTEDDRASMEDLAKVVGQDPALSAHVLIAANSAALRRGRELKSLDQCLVALGTRLVRTMAACLAIQSVFARTVGDQSYDLAGFWSHSLQVAELSRGIAAKLDRADFEEAYLAGLLHDVGQLLLLGGMGGRYGALLAWSRDEEALLALERPELGTDHAAVGAWLVDQWKLSSFMADAVLFHHCQPGQITAADPLSQIVWAAHTASAWAPGREDAAGRGHQFEAAAIESMLNLPAGSLADIHRHSFERVAQLASALGVNAAPDATTLPRSSLVPFESSRRPEHRDSQNQIEAAVRDMAIMEPLQHNLFATDSEAEVLQAIRESARILFGLGRLAFLVVRADQSVLSGASVGGQPALLQRLEIPMKAATSLAAAVALGEEPRATFDADRSATISLVDVQIARALGSEGVLYVPMRSRDRLVGVMAYGLSQAQFERSQKRLGWMTSFAHLAAVSVESRREVHARERQIEADLTSRFQQRARHVAHEAGNPLSIITNYLKIVSERLPDESGVRHELDILKEEIDRVALIIRHLSDMSVKAPAVGQVDVNAVIEGMAALYRESLFSSRGITLDLILDELLPIIPGSRDQIKQILLNLWKNAAEAMSAGGRLVISTTNNVRHNGRDHVEIRLADSGPGLPSDVIQNLFQPLDPNRRPGHVGMGLSIVAALVKGLDGQINFQSRAGQGTTFVILLPTSARSDQ
ncbi:MAG TPA: HDOD domain-containing protein [Rhodocyclaceae bacterium]|nr:HDOD domain-containing protein [Rhodocyclaceae bacterium]